MNTRAEGMMSRLSGRLLILVWAALLLAPVGAKATPVKTMIQDILYRADGQVAQGMLTIRWNAFSTSAGEAVPAGMLTATIGSDGSIAIPLIPNTGSTPSGNYYKVIVKLSDGTTSEENWVVPQVSTTTVAAVRANVVPQAVAAQFASRDYVDTALAAVVPASLVHVAGAETITGVKTYTVSPEVPAPADAGSAVARGYVDQQFGGLATVATTGNYNDLLNKPAGPNLASPGAIGSTAPGTVNATSYAVNGVPLASGNLSDGSALAKTNQANTFAQPQMMTDLLTNTTPRADIRAYGAVIDGATDIGSALSAATAAACTGSGVVYLPCAGSGCYLANASNLAQSNQSACSNRNSVQYKIQGVLKLGTTLVAPNNTQWICEGGATSAPQFAPKGPNCIVQAPAVYGTVGTTIAAGSANFTPTFTGGTIGQLPVGSAITVADSTSCNISSLQQNSTRVTLTLSANQCRIPAGAVVTLAGLSNSLFNTTPMLLASDYVAGAMVFTNPAGSWQANHPYSVGQYVLDNSSHCSYTMGTATSAGACLEQVTTAGTSGASTPSWNGTPSGTTTDGGVTWTNVDGISITGSPAGTVTGLNDDSFETAQITAVSGSQATATFAHAHSSTASFGAVGVMAYPSTYAAHSFQGVNVTGNYGAGWWFPHNAEVLLDGIGGNEMGWASSIPVEMASSFGWRITNSSLMTTTNHNCGTSCGQQGYPYGLRITSLTGQPDPADLNMIVDGNTFIVGGIKVDTNDQTGPLAKMGDLRLKDVTIEQPVGSALTIDPRGVTTNRAFTLSNVQLQDNFWNYPICMVGYTDPTGGGGAVVFNTLNVTLLNQSGGPGCLTNPYYNGALTVNGVDYTQGTLPLPRYLAKVGTLNDGVTLEGELRGEGAAMGPSLIPYATENVTTNPASWTCSGAGCVVNTGLEAPDGSATAGEIVSGTAGNSYVTVYTLSTATSAGDWIISGVWCMPGVNNVGACGNSSSFGTTWVYSYGSDQFDNTTANYASSQPYQSGYTADWWHPIVAANKITAGSGTSHNIQFRLYGPTTAGFGTRFWQPFMIYIPISAKPATMTAAQWDTEIARWREQLLHGHVSPNMPAGVLDMGGTLKLYWSNDTDLYRGAAGVVQTDGSFNIGSGQKYEVNGSQIATGNLGDWSDAGVSGSAGNGLVPIWNQSSQKWIPGSPSGSGTVTGTGVAGNLTEWATGGTAIQNAPISDSGTALTTTEPITLSGLPSGCVQLPCVVAKASQSGLSAALGTTNLYYSANGGTYRISFDIYITTAGTGGNIQAVGSWPVPSGSTAGSSYVASTGASNTAANGSWSGVIHVKAGGQIQYSTYFSSVTGSPVYGVDAVVEQLQ